ncbi:hypothetical protein ACDP63_01200 [Paracoccus sp. P2]|uniref:Uncharacterized protein n=1 Tax=Paracoccus pantotrophus TaxID=82367 RepID=A0A7H9C1L4_PARPN|nr:hypothetical protein [Paracoccus pantotrophus]MDF3854188.1 hypothetical protein [Paracoccus pantotrophus]QLH16866.1 hypothetical protein HYQ43_21895 [Paracoccus pantotrophus]
MNPDTEETRQTSKSVDDQEFIMQGKPATCRNRQVFPLLARVISGERGNFAAGDHAVGMSRSVGGPRRQSL